MCEAAPTPARCPRGGLSIGDVSFPQRNQMNRVLRWLLTEIVTDTNVNPLFVAAMLMNTAALWWML